MRGQSPGFACPSCGRLWPVREGILDTVGDLPGNAITPFQRLMQSRMVVSVYEGIWRRLGYWLASSRRFGDEIELVLRLQRGKECGRLLDLACGTGVFTRPLAGQASLVVGLDLSWPMLRQAQRLILRDGVRNVVLIRGTAFNLPFVPGTFDSVNCCGALHLFQSPEAALDEIARVLACDGHLCVQTTIRPDHSAGLAYFLERFIRFGFFSQADLQKKIFQRGFKILESERHRISYTFLSCHFS